MLSEPIPSSLSGRPAIAPPVVPGSEFGGRFKQVSQGSRQEAAERLRVFAVNDELQSGSHRAPKPESPEPPNGSDGIGSAVALALACMPRVKVGCPGRRLAAVAHSSPPCSGRRAVTENGASRRGAVRIAGVDEVGRGSSGGAARQAPGCLSCFQHGQVADREPVVLDLLVHHHADALDTVRSSSG